MKVTGSDITFGPEYGTEEAVEYQRRAFVFMKRIFPWHFLVGFVGVVSAIGGIVCGFMVDTINYPVIDGLPLLASLLALLSSYCALKLARCTPKVDVEPQTRRYFMGHYMISVFNVTFGLLAASFAGWAIGVCNSTAAKDTGKCSPNHGTIIGLAITNCVVGVLIGLTCIPSMVYFCIYARAFGFTNTADQRVTDLERRVAVLQSQVDNQGPPPYSIEDRNPPSYQNQGFKFNT